MMKIFCVIKYLILASADWERAASRPPTAKKACLSWPSYRPPTKGARPPGIFQSLALTCKKPAGLEKFNIREESAGPPGEDLEIRLSGGIPEKLKAASLALQQELGKFPDCHCRVTIYATAKNRRCFP